MGRALNQKSKPVLDPTPTPNYGPVPQVVVKVEAPALSFCTFQPLIGFTAQSKT